MKLSHVDSAGKAVMVDVSAKPIVRREATACGKILLQPKTVSQVRRNRIQKGDVLATARIAAICGAKKASDLIPLCHNIPMDRIDVELEIERDGIAIRATAAGEAKTGVEMEALTAVAVAALTVYDMCKAVDKQMVIGDIRLLRKLKHGIRR
jgi:cyclic pyranopterin monophosphate synthase